MPADTELKKLNKTVDEAVKTLKIYMGNPAQQANMNEKQKEAINKWFDVAETIEDQEKKQRAFTERARDESGKFLKKQENMAGTFMNVAKSVGGMFKDVAKGIGGAMWGAAKGFVSHIKGFFSSLKSHFVGLFGEESEWFDILGSVKDSMKGLLGWVIKGFTIFIRKTPKWAMKQNKILMGMFNLQLKQMKMEFLAGSGIKKKGGILAMIGLGLFIVAALIGGWIRKKLLAVELILKQFKIKAIFTRIGDWFKLKFGNLIRTLRGKFRWVDELSDWFKTKWIKHQKSWLRFKKGLTGFGKFLLKTPILGRVVKGLMWGFKWLLWPLTILLSIIDFIIGWRSTVGTWQDKLIGGLKSVMMGFIELPLIILGWVWDSIMKFFGVQSSGTGDKLVKWADKLVDFILEFGPIGIITDIVRGFQTGDWAGIITRKFEKFQGLFMWIIDFVYDIWNGFLDWAAEKASWIPGASGLIEGMKLDRPEGTPKAIEKSAADYTRNHEMRKLGINTDQAKDLKKSVDEGTQATKDSTKKTEALTAITIANQNNQNQQVGGGENEQIPDELDNYIMAVKNYGGDFD